MTIDPQSLIIEVRNNLSDLPFDLVNDVLIYKSIQDAYDFIQMVVDETYIEEKFVRRCLIRLSTYNTYLNYTALAESKMGTLPESAGLQLSSLLMKSYQCLSLISKVTLNPDLSYKEETAYLPVGAAMSGSNIVT